MAEKVGVGFEGEAAEADSSSILVTKPAGMPLERMWLTSRQPRGSLAAWGREGVGGGSPHAVLTGYKRRQQQWTDAWPPPAATLVSSPRNLLDSRGVHRAGKTAGDTRKKLMACMT
ncbi:hypothetical protein E2562_031342 [Oryza meyeriana var. granulata]|uniref:Uncharacterized protein n=1 Tax=Oryza meyeriana var. granulata TaxID=110450 RepID=A0A6G1D8J6_9ORYZ|nr:hypothetical protein E2562_031342 [Oryza meyeriana var. granulata]